jgi:hypothetical protein
MSEQPYNTNELLIRLDERTSSIKKELESMRESIAELKRQVKEEKMDERTNLKNYITKDEFAPIQKSVYAVASFIIMTVIGTIISLVVQKGPPL